MIILALAIVIIVLIVVSSTAAWYIRTKSDSADIVLSYPVDIYITENDSPVEEICGDYNGRIYPGDKVKLNLGMRIGSEEKTSSSGYVRVKLSMKFTKINDDPEEKVISLEDLAQQGLIEYEDKPDENTWELVDFNQFKVNDEDYTPDYWYVYKIDNTANGTVARVAQDGDKIKFLDNKYIRLSKENITNEYANYKFNIVYTVEAIQVANVPNPLQYKGYGPWWKFIKGDNEDIPGWKSDL